VTHIDNLRLMEDNKAYVAVKTAGDLEKVRRYNKIS